MIFYKEKIQGAGEDGRYKDLSIEGFHCIQSFFIMLNAISGGLVRLTDTYGTYKGKHLVEQKKEKTSTTTSTSASTSTGTGQIVTDSIEFNKDTQQYTTTTKTESKYKSISYNANTG